MKMYWSKQVLGKVIVLAGTLSPLTFNFRIREPVNIEVQDLWNEFPVNWEPKLGTSLKQFVRARLKLGMKDLKIVSEVLEHFGDPGSYRTQDLERRIKKTISIERGRLKASNPVDNHLSKG